MVALAEILFFLIPPQPHSLAINPCYKSLPNQVRFTLRSLFLYSYVPGSNLLLPLYHSSLAFLWHSLVVVLHSSHSERFSTSQSSCHFWTLPCFYTCMGKSFFHISVLWLLVRLVNSITEFSSTTVSHTHTPIYIYTIYKCSIHLLPKRFPTGKKVFLKTAFTFNPKWKKVI